MIRSFLFSILFVSSISAVSAGAAVWNASNSWNSQWEERYTQWVKSSWSTSTFSNSSSPFYKLKPDCADTVYSMRMIFAYNNSLPFEIVDPTNTSRRITNTMSRFDDQAAAKRPRAFLAYLYNIVSTRSLPNDSFPVQINRSQFRPGIFGLAVKANHHSWTVKNINEYGVPTFYYSTVGNSGNSVVELQVKNAWYNPYWVFEGAISGDRASASSHAGYRAFKWPSELGTSALLVSRASTEQYQIPVSKWVQRVQAKIGTSTESSGQTLGRLLEDSCRNFQARVDAVNDGWNFVRNHSGRCLSQDEFYQFSTPSRDRRALEELVALRSEYKSALSNGESIPSSISGALSAMFPNPNSSFASETSNMGAVSSNYCKINWASGYSTSLPELRRRLAKGWMSNNPLDEPTRRWGETRSSGSMATSCPNYNDSWVPNLADY